MHGYSRPVRCSLLAIPTVLNLFIFPPHIFVRVTFRLLLLYLSRMPIKLLKKKKKKKKKKKWANFRCVHAFFFCRSKNKYDPFRLDRVKYLGRDICSRPTSSAFCRRFLSITLRIPTVHDFRVIYRAQIRAITSLKVARNSFHFPQTSFTNSFVNTVWFIVSV